MTSHERRLAAAICLKHNLSKSQTADKLGVSITAISKMEKHPEWEKLCHSIGLQETKFKRRHRDSTVENDFDSIQAQINHQLQHEKRSHAIQTVAKTIGKPVANFYRWRKEGYIHF